MEREVQRSGSEYPNNNLPISAEQPSVNAYYVYAYLDPRKHGVFEYEELVFDYQPFYIGKGSNDRINSHVCEAKSSNKKTYKLNKIRRILSEGLEPIRIIIKDSLSEEDAFSLEKETISKIGFWLGKKYQMKIGPLTNSTPGGENPPKAIKGLFHTSIESKNGTHHWIGRKDLVLLRDKHYQELGYKNAMDYRSKNGTHWWSRENGKNPIYKYYETHKGKDHFRNHREMQESLDNYLDNINPPDIIKLTNDLAKELGYKSRTNLVCSILNRLKIFGRNGIYILRYGSRTRSTYYLCLDGSNNPYYNDINRGKFDMGKVDDMISSPL